MKLVAASRHSFKRLKISTATPLSAYNQGKPDLSWDTPTQHLATCRISKDIWHVTIQLARWRR